jgi:arabinogalactan endo-1,4-beta-galactosidase
MGTQVGDIDRTMKNKILYSFRGFVLAAGTVVLMGCGGGAGGASKSTPPSTAPAPTFSLEAGIYATAQTVTISDAIAGATIYYTTNGATPTTASSVYSSAVTIPAIPATETIQAIAVATGYANSTVASAVYTMTSPPATATVVGADVGWMIQLESMGYTWTDTTGASESALQILKNHGVNTIRIRTFVNPTITSGVLGVGNDNQAGSIALAVLANSMGFKIMIDFHLSDTWADPGDQTLPAAWASDSYAQLQTDVYNYTFNFMTALAAAGITPQYVQVGNEINSGMLWPIGSVGATTPNGNNFTQVAGLINQGYSAVKAVSPTTKVVIHLAGISNLSDFEWFFDGLTAAGGNFDIVGGSYYDGPSNITTVAANLNTLAARYNKPVLICEIGYLYSDPTDAYNDVQGAIHAMNAVPSNMGLGAIYWEPEAPDNVATSDYTMGAATAGSGNVLQFTTAINAF